LAFIDKNGNNDYDSGIVNSSNDTDLRSVLINNESITISSLDIALSNPTTDKTRFIYMPNGTFGVGKSNGQYTYSSNYIRIAASDGKHVRMALIAPSGRVITCNGNMTPSEFNSLTASSYATYCALS
jgi:hypothetical protein